MKIKEIIKLVLDDIASVYPYILAFYIVSLILSRFFESWKLFFYWPAFNAIVIFFGILCLLNKKSIESIKHALERHRGSKVSKVYKVEKSIKSLKRAPERHKESKIHKVIESVKFLKSTLKNLKVGNFAGLKFAMLESYKIFKKGLENLLVAAKNDLLERKMKMAGSALKICGRVFLKTVHGIIKIVKAAAFLFFIIAKQIFKALINLAVLKIKRLRKIDYLKTGIIAITLIYAVKNEIAVIDFLVLTYGLISILFIIESRIAAGIALFFLICVPFLLIYKKDTVAETAAIYAYYFLVITVITQIREYQKEVKENKEYYRK